VTVRNRECKVQAHGLARVCTYGAYMCLALALALSLRSSPTVTGHEKTEPDKAQVILPAQDIRLPEVLRHIEAGKIVLVILTPCTKAKLKQDKS
jgi:hypothetical protein